MHADAEMMIVGLGDRLRLAICAFDRFDFLARLARMLDVSDVTLSITCSTPATIGAALADGLADVLFTPAAMAPSGHLAASVFRDRLVVVTTPDHPLALSEPPEPKAFVRPTYLTWSDHPSLGFEY